MDEFLKIFGNITLTDLIIFIMACGFIIDKGKNIIKWITNKHDQDQERDNNKTMMDEQNKKISYLMCGMLALISNDLYDRCEQALAIGEITINDLEKIKRLYEPYHALGGNGTGTKLYNDVLRLRIKH